MVVRARLSSPLGVPAGPLGDGGLCSQPSPSRCPESGDRGGAHRQPYPDGTHELESPPALPPDHSEGTRRRALSQIAPQSWVAACMHRRSVRFRPAQPPRQQWFTWQGWSSAAGHTIPYGKGESAGTRRRPLLQNTLRSGQLPQIACSTDWFGLCLCSLLISIGSLKQGWYSAAGHTIPYGEVKRQASPLTLVESNGPAA